MVVAVALLERRDVGADQPGLVALDPGVGIGELDLAGADRLDLGAGQDDPGLERFLDAELMSRSSIERDGLLWYDVILPYLRRLRSSRISVEGKAESSTGASGLRSP